tara:strand:+ start:8511 stop:9032 length:522 start_codon:yes stop_codon:yes gene_type:complete
MNIVLIGMMGVGKSAIGRRLSQILQIPFLDIDKIIEQKEGKAIAKIFTENGEEFFRNIELKISMDILQENSHTIISTGGGAIMHETIRNKILSDNRSIWLNLSKDQILKRVQKNSTRPLIKKNPQKVINELIKDRLIYYQMADIHINCNNKNINKCANEIIQKLNEMKKNEKD